MSDMPSTEQKTCDQRIADHMAGREEYLRGLYTIADGTVETDDDGLAESPDGDMIDQDDAVQAIDELPLAVSVVRVLRIDLSTGGPADYVTAELDGTDVQSVTYHFADWFDHADRPVPQDSPLWRLAEYYAEIV